MIKVQQGKGGLNSPKNALDRIITIERGVYSRTGRTTGNVDEAPGIRVTGWGPVTEHGWRPTLLRETLFGADRYDATRTNRIGGQGAYVTDPPTDAAIDAAVARIRSALEAGES